MKAVIIFGSCYGTSAGYAQKLSAKTGIPAFSHKDSGNIPDFDTLIYVGGLYAGGVFGLKRTLKRFAGKTKSLYIITVGIADTLNDMNIKHIRASLQKQVPKDLYFEKHLFHLRGAIDYGKLNFVHRMMMKMLYYNIKKIPVGKCSADDEALIETYGKKVDFTDYSGIDKIIDLTENFKS